MNQKRAKNERITPFCLTTWIFVNHVFQPLQLDLRSKFTLFKSYCSTLGSKELNLGKDKPYCWLILLLTRMWACWCGRQKCNLRCQNDSKHSLWYKILSILWPTPWKQGIWRMVSWDCNWQNRLSSSWYGYNAVCLCCGHPRRKDKPWKNHQL